MNLKWQIDINKEVFVPFTRGLCSVGVRCLNLKFHDDTPPDIVHIMGDPISHSGKFWINDRPCGYCLKSTINCDRGTTLSQMFTRSDTEFHPMNLLDNWSVKLTCVDQCSSVINASGYCILDVHLKGD